MRPRPGDVYLGLTAAAGALLAGLLTVHPLVERAEFEARTQASAALMRELSLTDLALLGEAAYTRHPASADLFTPFQSHPMSLDLLPAGSLMPPPAHLTRAEAPAATEGDGHARP